MSLNSILGVQNGKEIIIDTILVCIQDYSRDQYRIAQVLGFNVNYVKSDFGHAARGIWIYVLCQFLNDLSFKGKNYWRVESGLLYFDKSVKIFPKEKDWSTKGEHTRFRSTSIEYDVGDYEFYVIEETKEKDGYPYGYAYLKESNPDIKGYFFADIRRFPYVDFMFSSTKGN